MVTVVLLDMTVKRKHLNTECVQHLTIAMSICSVAYRRIDTRECL